MPTEDEWLRAIVGRWNNDKTVYLYFDSSDVYVFVLPAVYTMHFVLTYRETKRRCIRKALAPHNLILCQ